MCGVVNVTHVERRGHDQVGSGWQDSAFDASMLRICVCVYVCMCMCVYGKSVRAYQKRWKPSGWLVCYFCTLLCRARNKNSPVIVMCFQWDRKQRGGIAASTFETMKADWIRGLRARGLDFAFFFPDKTRSARFEEDRLFELILDGSWINDVSFLLLSVGTRAVIYRRMIFIPIYWPPDALWYITHWTMTLLDAFRNLWECGYKELLSARSGAHDYYMDGFSFVRGKWMVALKKNARLILILRLRGEDSRLIPGRTRRERFNDSGGRQRFRTSVMLSVSLPPLSDAPFH